MSVLQSACVCIVQNSMPRGACGFYLFSAELQQQFYQCFITKQWPMTLYKQVLGDAGEEKIPFYQKETAGRLRLRDTTASHSSWRSMM